MWGFITEVTTKVPANLRNISLHKMLLGKTYLILFCCDLPFFFFFQLFLEYSIFYYFHWAGVCCQLDSEAEAARSDQ